MSPCPVVGNRSLLRDGPIAVDWSLRTGDRHLHVEGPSVDVPDPDVVQTVAESQPTLASDETTVLLGSTASTSPVARPSSGSGAPPRRVMFACGFPDPTAVTSSRGTDDAESVN